MIEALGVLGVAACAWAALVAVVRWAAPWLQARVLPHGVTVSASWACIAVNSELVPRFLRTQQRSQAPAHTALHSHDAVLDMGADLDSDSGVDSDDADEQAAAARPQRRGRKPPRIVSNLSCITLIYGLTFPYKSHPAPTDLPS